MEITFKQGVTPEKLTATTFRGIFACAEIFQEKNLPLTITSTHEGQHSVNSFHHIGQAFDIRTWRLPKTFIPSICLKLEQALWEIDKHFQVIQEDTHIHIELDKR